MATPLLARRLIEPDYWTCPHGFRTRPVHTLGPAVADINAAAGLIPDPQQELGLDLIFAVNPDGSPACFEFCVICARQNLKTGLFLMAVVGWLFVLDVPEVVWSAHEMATTRQAQRDLGRLLTSTPSLSKHLLKQRNHGIYDANGEERIELATEQTIWFRARTRDGGRGLAKPKLILDEAFALKAAMMGALIPIMLAQFEPQVLLGSSPGKADSEVLFDVRDRGRNHLSPRMTYLEWSNGQRPPCRDEDCRHPKTGLEYGAPCVANRLELIEHANPTLTTGRITVQTLADVRQILTADEWFRECAGYWEEPAKAINGIFGPGRWAACALVKGLEDSWPDPPAPKAIGVAVSRDKDWSSIARCGTRDDGIPCLNVSHRLPGTDQTYDEVVRIMRDHNVPAVIDEKCPDAALVKKLAKAGAIVLKLEQVLEATSDLETRVKNRTVTHMHDDELDDAEKAADWRYVSDRRAIGRKTGDASMLEAANLALWGANQPEVQPWVAQL